MARIDEEYESRKTKLEHIVKLGLIPFPARTARDFLIHQALEKYSQLEKNKTVITLAGRIKAIRAHGGSAFLNIEDESGQFQIFAKKDTLQEIPFNNFIEIFDIGDFIECTGLLFLTKKGEKTLLINEYKILAKALLPLPEKWHGLTDMEIRYRQRYLDLISNPVVRDIFKKRAVIISAIRKYLDENGFIEVETPILQPIAGGANARPFVTHHNSLHADFYLRIAPELYLKKLLVGGLEKIYEISRCFRNEGVDRDHNPEFTQVEFYAAFWDYKKMMSFTESLFHYILGQVNAGDELVYENQKINFKQPFHKITFLEACKKFAKIDIANINEEDLRDEARKKNIDIPSKYNKAKIIDEIFKELVRPNLIQPTFLIDHPIELSPLAKKTEKNPAFVERFQLIIAGKELCNAFSELNDPIDQEERFKSQEKMRLAGDDEAQMIDDDFMTALKQGMPPAAGIGIGIDRLTNLITNTHNLKEVILFPTLKQKI